MKSHQAAHGTTLWMCSIRQLRIGEANCAAVLYSLLISQEGIRDNISADLSTYLTISKMGSYIIRRFSRSSATPGLHNSTACIYFLPSVAKGFVSAAKGLLKPTSCHYLVRASRTSRQNTRRSLSINMARKRVMFSTQICINLAQAGLRMLPTGIQSSFLSLVLTLKTL